MTSRQAIDLIYSLRTFAKKAGLSKITRLLELMGNPQNSLKFVHIAGTNGKGSTTAMTASVLRHCGYRTGMFISPYIIDFRERMQIDGEMISEQELVECVTEVWRCVEIMKSEDNCPTEFEVVTAVGMLFFARNKCDIVVLEVGLGGRFDATNVISSAIVSAICSISLDHTQILGDTTEQIAFEKCGILKTGVPCVCYPMQDIDALGVIMEQTALKNCRLIIGNRDSAQILSSGADGSDIVYGGIEIHVPFIGEHQICNCITAVEILLELRSQGWNIPNNAISDGIASTFFPARMEIISRSPLVIVDGAHNESGAQVLAQALSLVPSSRITSIIGMLMDKDVERSVSQILPLCSKLYTVTPDNIRAMPAHKLAETGREYCSDVTVCDSLEQAFADAYEQLDPDDILLICGSLYLASDMRIVAKSYYDTHGIAYSQQL